MPRKHVTAAEHHAHELIAEAETVTALHPRFTHDMWLTILFLKHLLEQGLVARVSLLSLRNVRKLAYDSWSGNPWDFGTAWNDKKS